MLLLVFSFFETLDQGRKTILIFGWGSTYGMAQLFKWTESQKQYDLVLVVMYLCHLDNHRDRILSVWKRFLVEEFKTWRDLEARLVTIFSLSFAVPGVFCHVMLQQGSFLWLTPHTLTHVPPPLLSLSLHFSVDRVHDDTRGRFASSLASGHTAGHHCFFKSVFPVVVVCWLVGWLAGWLVGFCLCLCLYVCFFKTMIPTACCHILYLGSQVKWTLWNSCVIASL